MKNTHDITIMCEPKVFRVLTEKKSKPVENMFAFAVDFINNENFSKKIKKLWKKELESQANHKDEEDWDAFSAKHNDFKTSIKLRNVMYRKVKAEKIRSGKMKFPYIEPEKLTKRQTTITKNLKYKIL